MPVNIKIFLLTSKKITHARLNDKFIILKRDLEELVFQIINEIIRKLKNLQLKKEK